MKFVWDDDKNKSNIRDHGVSFKEASSVFDDKEALIVDNIYHSFDEDRFLIIGRSYMKRVLFVCFCERQGDIIRLISARKAEKEEREEYYAYIKAK